MTRRISVSDQRVILGLDPENAPDPVECSWCGGEVDPSSTCPRAVDCPTCKGRAGGPCYRPSGHRATRLHASRVALAESLEPTA